MEGLLHGCARSAAAALDWRRSAGWRRARARHAAGNDDGNALGDAIEVIWGGGRAEGDKVHVPCACAMIAAVRRERESIGERRWMGCMSRSEEGQCCKVEACEWDGMLCVVVGRNTYSSVLSSSAGRVELSSEKEQMGQVCTSYAGILQANQRWRGRDNHVARHPHLLPHWQRFFGWANP